MSRRARAVTLALTVLAVSGCGDEGSVAEGSPGVAVTDAWARATVAAASTGAVYLVLDAATDDELVGAVVGDEIAAAATLHDTVTVATGHDDDDDHGDHGAVMVTMSELPALTLPAGERVVLEPGGRHLMLSGLAGPLVTGTVFELTLQFTAAPDETVTVEVRDDA